MSVQRKRKGVEKRLSAPKVQSQIGTERSIRLIQDRMAEMDKEITEVAEICPKSM